MASSVFLVLGDQTFPGNVTIGGNLSVTGSITGSSSIMAGASSAIGWTGLSQLKSPSDGVISLLNNAGTDFSRLQFGGTTSSFPSLKRNATQVDFRAADDSGYVGVRASYFTALSFIVNNGGGTAILISGTAPTISSGFGTNPSISSNNGTASFRINVGTGGVATSGVVGLPTAANGWNAIVSDLTGGIATRVTASSTTTITITGASAWAASSTLIVQAMAY